LTNVLGELVWNNWDKRYDICWNLSNLFKNTALYRRSSADQSRCCVSEWILFT